MKMKKNGDKKNKNTKRDNKKKEKKIYKYKMIFKKLWIKKTHLETKISKNWNKKMNKVSFMNSNKFKKN